MITDDEKTGSQRKESRGADRLSSNTEKPAQHSKTTRRLAEYLTTAMQIRDFAITRKYFQETPRILRPDRFQSQAMNALGLAWIPYLPSPIWIEIRSGDLDLLSFQESLPPLPLASPANGPLLIDDRNVSFHLISLNFASFGSSSPVTVTVIRTNCQLFAGVVVPLTFREGFR
jgi:hypothetical protein